MSELETLFIQAQADVTSLAERPNNATLLKLYALYKKETEGDVHGDKPGIFDLVAKKKYEAWQKIAGLSSNEDMQSYINEVKSLLNEE